jgi:uncharacterized lipoprotein YmbA
MTPVIFSRRRVVTILGLLPAMTGCSSSTPPRVFTLAPQPAPPAGSASMKLMVKPVEVPKYLDRSQIVRQSDGYELQIADLERWGESLRDMTMRVLIENLSLRLPASQIVSETSPVDLTADATIEVDVSRFDADPSGQAVLDARWAVKRDGRPTRVRLERIRVQPTSGSTNDMVAAMSDALGQLSDQIVLGLVT